MKDTKIVAVMECPICNHSMDFILYKDATLRELETMSEKKITKKRIFQIILELTILYDKELMNKKMLTVSDILELLLEKINGEE